VLSRATVVWIFGLVTLVPYGIYYLLYHAERDQYALLISLLLFWIFGFWGVVGPLIGALKVRAVFRAIEQAQKKGNLIEVLRSQQTEDAVIELIALENKIPRFLARKVYKLFAKKYSTLVNEVSGIQK